MRALGVLTAFFFTTGLALSSVALAAEQRSQSAIGSQSSEMSSQVINTAEDLKQFSLQDQQGQNLGQIDEVLADVQQGKIGFVISSSQQQPGQQHAIPWDALQVDTQQQTLTLQISSEQFQQAPTGDAQAVQNLNQARQIEEFYGVSPQWGEAQTMYQQAKALEDFKQFSLLDQTGQNLGQIDQVLVDTQRGQIGYIGTSSQQQPGQKHVIPWNALSVDLQQQALTVQISADQLQQAPTGDAQTVRDMNQAEQIHQFYGVSPYWEAQQRQPMAQQPQQIQQMTQTFEQVTTVDNLKQFSLQDQQGQNLGQVEQLIVDVQQGSIGYVVTSSQQQPGQQHVIPWNALRVDPQQQTLTVQISAEQFRQAPTGDEQMVKDPDQARQIHQFYGVAPYWETGAQQQQMQQMMEQHQREMHQQPMQQRQPQNPSQRQQ
jgi:sporulation protein YlmC with PRC-barrel domain